MALPRQFRGRLSLPAVAAPMFLVSNPELTIACCTQGIIGSFPSLNARTLEDFERWLRDVTGSLAALAAVNPTTPVAPFGVNLVVHRTNSRLDADLELIVRYKVPLVITSVGNPSHVVAAVQGYGGVVFHDVINLRHARKAADAGVDGLILVSAGAGGHGGLMSPFAFVPQVRDFFDGTIILAGGISDGRGIRAATAMGADLAYLGTRFIAVAESGAKPAYKRMVVDSTAEDIVYTPAFSGIHANMLRPSIRAAGLDPDNLPDKKEIRIGEELQSDAKAWRDIWSAGHGVGSVRDVPTVAALVARLRQDYEAAGAVPAL